MLTAGAAQVVDRAVDEAAEAGSSWRSVRVPLKKPWALVAVTTAPVSAVVRA